jgi:hypothetical protein
VLRQAIKKAQKEEGTFPEGHLRISVDKGYLRCYQVTEPGDNSGKYILKKERSRASKLAQKDYNTDFLMLATKELERLEKSIKVFSKENADNAFNNLPLERQCLISPYILSDDQYAAEWEKRNYLTNQYLPEDKRYETKKGEMVRSKSESIIADILCDLGIPYHYEQALKLRNGAIYYPDFTILNKKEREEMYLEHLGLLDEEGYRKNNLIKMDEYRANGIYIGKNLLITYETKESPLDIKGIRKMFIDLFVE